MSEWVFFINPERETIEYAEGQECISCRACNTLDKMAGMKCLSCASMQLCIDPHTQGLVYRASKKCEWCDEWKSEDYFYEQAVTCKLCYDRHWSVKNESKSHWELATHLHKTISKANRRNRYRRSNGPPIEFHEVEQLWRDCDGSCVNCDTKLTFDWHPRKANCDYGVLDRIRTEGNHSYHKNAQFMCTACNTEKGGFDLVKQQNRRITKQKRKIQRLEKQLKRYKKSTKDTHYASILIQH